MRHWITASFPLHYGIPSKYNPRGVPDMVAEEIATVLTSKGALEFKAFFTIVYKNRHARKPGGGEEMRYLRVY